MNTKEIIAAASKHLGRQFRSIREIEIFLEGREQESGEISPFEMFKLGFQLPFNFSEAANCVGEHSDDVKDEMLRAGISTMQELVPRNQLFMQYDPAPCKVTKYVNGKPTQEYTI